MKADFNSKLNHLNFKVDRLEAQFEAEFAELMMAIQSTRKKPMQEEGSLNSIVPPLQNTTQKVSHMKQHEMIPPKMEQNHRVVNQRDGVHHDVERHVRIKVPDLVVCTTLMHSWIGNIA